MDKTQALQIAHEAFQLLKNSDIQFMYNPWQAFLSSKLVQYTTWSIVLVASSYSIGVFFEKVLPNLPYLRIFGQRTDSRRHNRNNKYDSPYKQDHHDTQENENDDYPYQYHYWPFNFLKRLNSSY